MPVNPVTLVEESARLALRVAGFAVRTGVSLAGRVLPFGGGGEAAPAPVPEREEPRRREPRRSEPRRSEPPTRSAEPSWSPADSPPAPPGPEEPVSEEPVLVAEFADEGAEEGAGAEIEVAEPWPGYAQMKAGEVVARLEQASPAEVAVIQLHESANKRRKSVLAAAERRLAGRPTSA